MIEAYNGIIEKVYKPDINCKMTWDDIKNVSKDELEVMWKITANVFSREKAYFIYAPFTVNTWNLFAHYFLDYDKQVDGTIAWREYINHPHFAGYKALNKEKSWFIKIQTIDYQKSYERMCIEQPDKNFTQDDIDYFREAYKKRAEWYPDPFDVYIKVRRIKYHLRYDDDPMGYWDLVKHRCGMCRKEIPEDKSLCERCYKKLFN